MPGGEVGARVLRGSEETDEDWEIVMAPGPPVDRWSLRVDDRAPVDLDRPPSLWRPSSQGAGAASASGTLRVFDVELVVHALAVLRVFDGAWDCPGTGHCELVGAPPLVEVVVVGRLAVPRVPRTDWRGPGIVDWAVAGGSSTRDDVAAGPMLAAPRASPGPANWGRSNADASPLVLAAAERAAQAVAELLLFNLLLLLLLRASSSPSTLFGPDADHPLLRGRLTLGGASLPSSHEGPSSAQPAALSCGGEGE